MIYTGFAVEAAMFDLSIQYMEPQIRLGPLYKRLFTDHSIQRQRRFEEQISDPADMLGLWETL
jgi:hypothetical protein